MTQRTGRQGMASHNGEAGPASAPAISQRSGERFVLADLLRAWQIAPEFHAGISPRWRCELVPAVDSEEEIQQHVLDGTPVLVPHECGRAACAQVGDDALGFLTDDPARNQFPRPKIAFVAGWGGPGTLLDDDDELQLVDSFQSVLERSDSGKPLNLQMFHRDDEDAPRIPKLPEALVWPLPDLFGGGKQGPANGTEAPDVRHPCDMATRVSARGALTWWHLDDGGEFVMQVGLPLGPRSLQAPTLYGPNGKPIVKLFIFAARDAYEFICQDAETNKTRKFSHLDLFNTPSHWLPEPCDPAQGGDPLPVLWVAPLEAGGRPLLSPPNVPHLVITLQHCVMVEQRIISVLFLDEVHYFMAKAARDWDDQPKMYPLLTETLQDPAAVKSQVLLPLKGILLSHPDARVRARARASLQTIVAGAGKFFKVDAGTVAECNELLARPEVVELPLDKRAEMHAQLLGALASKRLPAGVTELARGRWAACVHVRGRPMWGRVRESMKEAVADRKELLSTRKLGPEALEAFFRELRPAAQL